MVKTPGTTHIDFPQVTEVDETCFVKGAIIDEVPSEMQMEPHQFMGQPSPYDDSDDSSLNESDDEQIVAVMSDDKFVQQVKDLIHSIVTGDYTLEAAKINIQQIKHGFSKGNDACQNAILPAILSEIATLMTPGMTNAEKLPILQQHLSGFKEMLNSFMNDQADEENIVFLVA